VRNGNKYENNKQKIRTNLLRPSGRLLDEPNILGKKNSD
jgi:hypothetical protein